MGVGAGLYMYDVVVKSSRSLSHLLTSSCFNAGKMLIALFCPFSKARQASISPILYGAQTDEQ